MACSLFDRSIGHVVSLQDLCLLTVSGYLSSSNVWSIHRLVPYVHCTRIEHIVHSFICDNFMDISHTNQFLTLDEKEMHWLLDNQDIKVSEAAMLDSLAQWYKHDEKQRENAFKQLFDKIHLNVIGKDVLSAMIKKYQLVKVIPGLRKYKKLLPQRMNQDDLIFKENISNIGFLQNERYQYVQKEDTLRYWMPLTSKLLNAKCKFSAQEDCWMTVRVPYGNNEVFILGSILGLRMASQDAEGGQTFNIRFNLISQTFKICTPFVDSSAYLSEYISVSCGNFIFFIRGRLWPGVAKDTMNAYPVYRYDTTKDHWQEVEPTITTQSFQTNCAVSFKNRYLYVFGVFNSEMYDLATNTWTLLKTPWQGNLHNVHAATLGDRICVCLQDTTHVVFTLFDPVTKIWQSHGERQCHHITTETFFGQIFSLHFISHYMRKHPMLYLSLMNNDMVEQKRLISSKSSKKFEFSSSRMSVLSRGARLAIEQDKNVQHV